MMKYQAIIYSCWTVAKAAMSSYRHPILIIQNDSPSGKYTQCSALSTPIELLNFLFFLVFMYKLL